MVQKNPAATCPCGKGSYPNCCQPFHSGHSRPETAEALMRARYSAYSLGLEEFLINTWHPDTRPTGLDLQQEMATGKWLGLEVKSHEPAGDKAVVEFIARYKPKSGPASRLHERSRFVRENGHWFYVDGDLFQC